MYSNGWRAATRYPWYDGPQAAWQRGAKMDAPSQRTATWLDDSPLWHRNLFNHVSAILTARSARQHAYRQHRIFLRGACLAWRRCCCQEGSAIFWRAKMAGAFSLPVSHLVAAVSCLLGRRHRLPTSRRGATVCGAAALFSLTRGQASLCTPGRREGRGRALSSSAADATLRHILLGLAQPGQRTASSARLRANTTTLYHRSITSRGLDRGVCLSST